MGETMRWADRLNERAELMEKMLKSICAPHVAPPPYGTTAEALPLSSSASISLASLAWDKSPIFLTGLALTDWDAAVGDNHCPHGQETSSDTPSSQASSSRKPISKQMV